MREAWRSLPRDTEAEQTTGTKLYPPHWIAHAARLSTDEQRAVMARTCRDAAGFALRC